MFGRKSKIKRLKGNITSVLEHLKEANLLEKVDLKDVLKHVKITIKPDGSATISFDKSW